MEKKVLFACQQEDCGKHFEMRDVDWRKSAEVRKELCPHCKKPYIGEETNESV